ncbi:MAG: hypothetical protein M0R48_01350 [Candidatus Omnitrophica bacterium]|jgi:hypothetical protein|nr:hypothetical protein [Candidatus Omnitrophota bacterium]
MIELIKDETIAIKTARASAVKEKLRPKGNCLKKTICSPERMRVSITRESRNEEKTKQKARIFLKRRLNNPAKGRTADPAIGIRMVRIRIVSGMFMEYLIIPRGQTPKAERGHSVHFSKPMVRLRSPSTLSEVEVPNT